MIKEFDIIIIGGGPAGLSAGIYAVRGGVKTLVIEREFCGGQMVSTGEIENFRLMKEVIYDPMYGEHMLVGLVGEQGNDMDLHNLNRLHSF